MAHQVENMFSVRETPWHGLGYVIKEAPSMADGIKLAGLDWEINVVDAVRADGGPAEGWGRFFVRSDNNRVLGLVGPKTHPLQNAKAFSFFEPFLAAGEASLETAGSLCNGEKVWVMAKISRPNSVIVPGDEIAKFVLLSNSHDGTTAVRVGFTPVRVVCANTLAAAHGDKASKLIRVRHSAAVNKNVEQIRDVMNMADASFEATAEQYRLLATKSINQSDLRKYVKLVLKMDEVDAELPTKSKGILEKIFRLVEVGRGTEISGVRGTYWGAYNAVTEYLSYDRGHTQDSRLNSLWFGDSAAVNQKALDVALSMAS